MRIAVAGGTGAVGRHVVAALEASGHEALVLSRSNGIDLMNHAGLAGTLEGCRAVIDVSSTGALSTRKAISCFSSVCVNLLAAEHEARITHHVALSIAGAVHADSGHYSG